MADPERASLRLVPHNDTLGVTGIDTGLGITAAVGPSIDAALLRAVVDGAPDCIKIIEFDGTLSFLNASGRVAMEIDDWSAHAGARWETLWPASTEREVLDAVHEAREGRRSRFEAYCPTVKGSPRWWDVSVAPVTDQSGDVTHIVAVSRDVTERVQRENRLRLQELELNQLTIEQAEVLREQKVTLEANDALMREVDHRMKNSLAMLGSLLKMETGRVDDEAAKATLRAAAARVATIASVHEQLYHGTHKDALALDPYLSALVRDLAASMNLKPGGETVRVDVEADDIVMRGGKALALGLATVELVMNALRHGGGAVAVECRRRADILRLTVTDEGPGLPAGFDPNASRGLGMRVVQSSLAKLQAELTCANRPEGGARFEITWPA